MISECKHMSIPNTSLSLEVEARTEIVRKFSKMTLNVQMFGNLVYPITITLRCHGYIESHRPARVSILHALLMDDDDSSSSINKASDDGIFLCDVGFPDF